VSGDLRLSCPNGLPAWHLAPPARLDRLHLDLVVAMSDAG
jgi:hypothetical protein